MDNIIVTKTCDAGVWRVVVSSELEGTFQSAMTSSVNIPPAQWNVAHEYSVGSHTNKTFWFKQGTVIEYKEEVFGFCAGVIVPTTTIPNSPDNPAPSMLDCVMQATVLPIFMDSKGKLVQIPDPIYSIKSNCKCDVTEIEFTQLPQYGSLVSNKFEGTVLKDESFCSLEYIVDNVAHNGKEIIKYKMKSTCGDLPVGTIEIKLIPTL